MVFSDAGRPPRDRPDARRADGAAAPPGDCPRCSATRASGRRSAVSRPPRGGRRAHRRRVPPTGTRTASADRVHRPRDRALVARGGPHCAHVPGRDEIEIGWTVVPERWGEGLATELGAASLDVAFGAARVRRRRLVHAARNLGSRRVMEKLGFAFERDNAPTRACRTCSTACTPLREHLQRAVDVAPRSCRDGTRAAARRRGRRPSRPRPASRSPASSGSPPTDTNARAGRRQPEPPPPSRRGEPHVVRVDRLDPDGLEQRERRRPRRPSSTRRARGRSGARPRPAAAARRSRGAGTSSPADLPPACGIRSSRCSGRIVKNAVPRGLSSHL